jgi:hypothetical protein
MSVPDMQANANRLEAGPPTSLSFTWKWARGVLQK